MTTSGAAKVYGTSESGCGFSIRSENLKMPKFITIGYGDRAGYEKTASEIRDAAHANDDRLKR